MTTSVRCAGLTQAASELEGGESTDGKRRLFDAALYWALTAMPGRDRRRASPARDFADADQTRARVTAVRQLTARCHRGAAPTLQRCRAEDPRIWDDALREEA